MMRIDDEEFTRKIISNLGLNKKLTAKNQLDNADYDLKLGFRVFFLEPMQSTVKCFLFLIYRVMMLLLRDILIIFNIIDVILNKK